MLHPDDEVFHDRSESEVGDEAGDVGQVFDDLSFEIMGRTIFCVRQGGRVDSLKWAICSKINFWNQVVFAAFALENPISTLINN